jgi:hypothetical protein
VCVSSCPGATDNTKFICKDSIDVTSVATGFTQTMAGDCMWEMASSGVLNRCYIDGSFDVILAEAETVASANGVTLTGVGSPSESGTSGSGFVTDFLGDVYGFSGYIFGFGIGVATVVAFIYLYFLRIPGLLTIIIWTMILSIAVFLIAGAFMLYSLSDTWRSDGAHTSTEADGMLYVSYFVMGLSALYLCLILVLSKRINMAVSIVKEAARALGAMPTLIFSPIVQILGLVIFLVPWFIYMLYIASAGDMSIDPITGNRVFTYDTNSKYAFIYMLFCWFWTSEFLVACGQLVIALAISCWYFTRDKKETGQATVTWAAKSLFWYHLGTAAFGSLVIAIILTIRAIISYIQRKAKKSGNKILEYVMCILQCCMWCLEKIMRFLNKNAYIQTAIYGYSFCKACRNAFFLLLRNILRVAAVNMVADFVLLLGKVCACIKSRVLHYFRAHSHCVFLCCMICSSSCRW